MRTWALAVALLWGGCIWGDRDFVLGKSSDAGIDASPAPADACVPLTCESARVECGSLENGCGGELECGGCVPPEFCGAAEPNMCACGWSKEDVGPGAAPSLAVDALGQVHLAFVGEGAVRYSRRASDGSWSFEMVETGADLGNGLSLALAGSGAVHLSYRDHAAEELRHARRAPDGGWTASAVAFSDYYGTSLAVDADEGVHIAYTEWSSIRHAYRPAGGSWELEEIIGSHSYGRPSLALGPDGVHAAFGTFFSDDLYHAERPTGGSWTWEVADEGSQGTGSSILVDEAGGLHLSYVTGGSVRYARKPPGEAWEVEPIVDLSNDAGGPTSLALAPDGRVHVSYTDYSRFTGGSLDHVSGGMGSDWTEGSIDIGGSSGSLDVDADGDLHVAYVDRAQSGVDQVRYAVYACP